MRRLLVRDVNLLFTVAVVLIMSVLACFGWQRSVSTQHLRETTQHAAVESGLLEAVSQGLRDTERAQLAYLASGSRTDLMAYRGAVRRTDVLADRLDRQATRDPASDGMLKGMVGLIDLRQDVLAQEAALRSSGTPAATVMDMHRLRDLPRGTSVLDQLSAGVQTLDRKRQASLDVETQGLRSVRWLAAAVALLGLLGVLSLFRLLSGAWRHLARAETEQRKMALQLRGSLDSLSQGVAVFSDEGRMLNWNMQLRQILDLPPALLQSGLSYGALEQHLAAGGTAFLEPLQSIRDDTPAYDEIRPVVYERSVRRRAGAGETQIEIRRTLVPEGGFVLTLTDMTERVQAERMLHEAQKMQALGQLTGGIAHDFNNMLTVILGSLDIAASESAAREAAADTACASAPASAPGGKLVPVLITRMRRAAHAAESGAALTRQLLTFARKQPLAPVPVDLGSILPGLVPLLRHTIGENIVITFHAEAGLWPAVADPGQLESAVLNLALNARDAMPGGGSLRIEAGNLSFDPRKAGPHPELTQGEYVRISVADTGHGMSREVLARAFEPFFTTKSEERGTGLGLAMVFGFARQSGGLALIQSEPGEGTRITLYLPRAPTSAAVIAAPSMSLRETGAKATTIPPVGTDAPHILLVEDDASVREIASEVLRELGYRVSEACDAEAALSRLSAQQGPLDLLLTDLTLPGALDGRALAARVRQIQPAARVLYMSGHLEDASRPDGPAGEPSQWLGKPFRRAQLASKVGALVRSPADHSALLAS